MRKRETLVAATLEKITASGGPHGPHQEHSAPTGDESNHQLCLDSYKKQAGMKRLQQD